MYNIQKPHVRLSFRCEIAESQMILNFALNCKVSDLCLVNNTWIMSLKDYSTPKLNEV